MSYNKLANEVQIQPVQMGFDPTTGHALTAVYCGVDHSDVKIGGQMVENFYFRDANGALIPNCVSSITGPTPPNTNAELGSQAIAQVTAAGYVIVA